MIKRFADLDGTNLVAANIALKNHDQYKGITPFVACYVCGDMLGGVLAGLFQSYGYWAMEELKEFKE